MRVYIKRKMRACLLTMSRKLGVDISFLARSGGWLTIGKVVQAAAALFTASLFARFLTPETYGIYKYLLTLGEITLLATLSGAGIVLVRDLSRGRFAAAREVLRLWRFSFIGQALVALALSGWYIAHANYLFAFGVLIAAGGHAAILWLSRPLVALTAKERFDLLTIGSAVVPLAQACAIAAVFAFSSAEPSPLTLLAAYLGSGALAAAVFLAWISRRFVLFPPPAPSEASPSWRALLPSLASLSVATTLSGLMPRIEAFLTFQLLGPAALAIYTFSTAIPRQFSFFSKSLQQMQLARTGAHTLPEKLAAFPRKWWLTFFASCGIVGAYWITAPFIFQILFPQYLPWVALSQWYSLIYTILIPAGSAYTLLVQAERERVLSWVWMGALGIFGAGAAALAPHLGVIGILIASIVSYTIYALSEIALLSRITGEHKSISPLQG